MSLILYLLRRRMEFNTLWLICAGRKLSRQLELRGGSQNKNKHSTGGSMSLKKIASALAAIGAFAFCTMIGTANAAYPD
ncbi:MAG: hypothetical protein ACKPE2_31245, partial [Dolichospermum sp.]